MEAQKSETHEIRTSQDIVMVRQVVRRCAVAQGFNLVDQTKIVTASSELARNTLEYGGGGIATVESVMNGTRAGVRITFVDEGPGIENVEMALKDGFTTAAGMGLGLGGARRLSHDFEIQSEKGRGTRVMILRWRA